MQNLTRLEKDSIGELEVPADAYYGVQSLRGAHNFNILNQKLNPYFIKNMARIKKAAAIVNRDIGLLDAKKAEAIITACEEITEGRFRDAFIVDAIQGGAGTSANMNANEVIANRAIELLGGKKGDYSIVHPNDEVNMAQSTNDVIPTAGKMTTIDLLRPLLFNLKNLRDAFLEKADEADIVLIAGDLIFNGEAKSHEGFLKLLYGTALREKAGEYGYVALSKPPYTVLQSKWIGYSEMQRLFRIAEVMERYLESERFAHTLWYLTPLMSSPFAFWEGLSLYLERVDRRPLQKISQPDAFLYLLQYAKEGVKGMEEPTLRQMLCADFTQGENKNPPAFLRTE